MSPDFIQPVQAKPVGARREVKDMNDVIGICKVVETERSAKSHSLNARSSRSHAILTVYSGGKRNYTFIDLAGSERVSKSGVSEEAGNGVVAKRLHLPGTQLDIPGSRFDEARSVNASLSSLQRVISAIASRSKHIPYRDSTLTVSLKPSLSAPNVQIWAMLACREPVEGHVQESRSTMRFGRVLRTAGKSRVVKGATAEAGPGSEKERSANADVGNSKKEAEALSLRLEQVKAELEKRSNEEGHLNPAVAKATADGFLRNRDGLAKSKQRVAILKRQVLEGKDVKASLKAEMSKVDVLQGIVTRQLTTGIWIESTRKWKELEEERQQLEMSLKLT